MQSPGRSQVTGRGRGALLLEGRQSRRSDPGIAAVAVLVLVWRTPFLFAAFFNYHSDKRVEVDLQLQRALVS
jgi:hypothetical protein